MPRRNDVTRIVIDNGGHTCKVGFAGQTTPAKLMPNGLAKSKSEHKVFVADQLSSCQDFSALQYRLSLERGCLVNWDTQAEVWGRAFGPEVLKVNPADCSLLLSETPMHPTSIQDTLDEMLFEHFGFHSYCTRPAPALAALAVQQQQQSQIAAGASGAPDGAELPLPRPAALVVDCGFSATHCMPIFGGTPLNFATKRLNVRARSCLPAHAQPPFPTAHQRHSTRLPILPHTSSTSSTDPHMRTRRSTRARAHTPPRTPAPTWPWPLGRWAASCSPITSRLSSRTGRTT
jgi:actin-related protein